jgi:hypothetical protein
VAGIAKQVLHLDGHVVGHIGVPAVHFPHDAHRVRHPVPEVGIPEGDVPGAGVHLLVDVGEHDIPLHDPEPPVVDRDRRAVAAAVPAAATGLGVAGSRVPPSGIRSWA